MVPTSDSTLIKKNTVTWGKRKRGIPTEISGTVGGNCIVSEDLIVMREDRIVLEGIEPPSHASVVEHQKMLEILGIICGIMLLACYFTVIYQKSTSELEFQKFVKWESGKYF